MMGSVKFKNLDSRSLVFLLILVTVAVSIFLYQSTKYNPSNSQLPSYNLKIETRKAGISSAFNFTVGCIFSESGSKCLPKNYHFILFPKVWSYINLSSDVSSGDYHGVKVQINGSHGESFHVKSVTLQDKLIFDGQNSSVFKNVKGIKISPDWNAKVALFELTSDSASFDLDVDFSVQDRPATPIKYTTAVISAVLFLSVILLFSISGNSGGAVKNHPEISEKEDITCGRPLTKVSFLSFSLLCLLSVLFLSVFIISSSLFQFNEFSFAPENSTDRKFMIEVSDVPDFSYSLGSISFYDIKKTLIKVPVRFSTVRISDTAGGTADDSFRVITSSGSCEIKNNQLIAEGESSCRSDQNGRLYINFDSDKDSFLNVLLRTLVSLAVLGALYQVFRLLKFRTAMRLTLAFILISAYITGETCINIECNNIVFYMDYFQILPDVALKNICLVLFLFLLVELSFTRSFLCASSSILVLILVILYIALDWGSSLIFGVRTDLKTLFNHTGAGNSTLLVFVEKFFKSSRASWMVLAMFSCWIIIVLSVFRLKEKHSLKKYLQILLILNCIPFLKIYENFYLENTFLLRNDIFEIQKDYLEDRRNFYTENFPEYDWKPTYQTIDGLNRRKNVIILLVESLADAYSKYFSGLIGYTPNIDMLAEQNTAFLNYHSTGVETAPATYSIMTGKIFFPDLDNDSPDLHFEYDEALPKIMREEGYSTSAIYSAEDFAGLGDVYRNSGFEHLYGPDEPAYNGEKRYIFNSVADGVLLNHAADLISQFDHEASPHLTFIMTTSSHNPFVNPETGREGYREVISYVDREIGKFVKRLETSGFFDNGTLIIVGDHHPPFQEFEPGELEKYGEDLNRVPMIIIDRDIGRRVYNNIFGHESLKAIIEYLNLKKVKRYDYQTIPFWKQDESRSVTVLCPMLFQNHYLGGVMVSGPNGEQGIYDARGDRSKFIGHFLAPELEKEVAGRVKWFKREK